jgi:hypothetical protein
VRFREVSAVKISREMFQVAVSMRWQDTLEYVVALGNTVNPFPIWEVLPDLLC